MGRRTELVQLEQAWTAVTGGARQVIFLGGEPGAGKSRLLSEVCRVLDRRGATVLLGSCVADFGPPYQPFVDPIDHLLSGSLELTPPCRERLARLAGRLPVPDGIAATLPEPEYRRDLYEAAVDAVRVLAGRGPLVLALEDVHWAGAAALQLLVHLVEGAAECPLLVLATHRTTEPDRSTALVTTIAHLYRLDGVRRLDLPGLATEDIAEYLLQEGRLPAHRARVAAALLQDQTGGNPFLLRELWRDLAARGAAADNAGMIRAAQAPPSVRDSVQGRLARMEPPERQTVEIAAVIGEEVDLATVLAVSAWGEDSTLAALDAAAAFGLLEPAGPSGTSFRFVHALTRQAVLDLMPATGRARQHARIATIVESSFPVSERRTQRLAYHYAQAQALGHTAAAVRHLTDAAQSAARGLAHEDAATWYEQAAALVDEPVPRNDLLSRAARCHLLAGDFARARGLYEEVAATADPPRRLAAGIGYEAASWRPGRPGHRAVELLTEAMRGIDHDPADPLYVRALAALGRGLAFTGDASQAAVLGRAAVDHARALGDPTLLAHALQASLWNGLRPDDAPDKLARATELSRLAELTGDLGQLGPAAYYRAVISYLQGEPAGLVEAHRDLVRVARSTGETFFDYMAGCVRYARQFMVGDLAEADRTCAALLEMGAGFGSDDTEGASSVQTFMIRRETGAVEQVRPLISGAESPQTHWAPGLLALYTELGLDAPAARLLHWLLDDRVDRYRDSAQWPCVLVFLVEAALRVGDRPALAALRPMLADYAGANLVAGQFVAVFGSADRYLGRTDAMLGRPGAEDALQAAVAMDHLMGATLHEAESLAALAVYLRGAGGDRRRVDDLTAQARRLGDPRGLTRVLRMLERPRGGGVEESGLTGREQEVLRLISDGLANREISARLVISENTVANHVRSILLKTGAGNRTQAAMYASAHGLLGDGHRSEGAQ